MALGRSRAADGHDGILLVEGDREHPAGAALLILFGGVLDIGQSAGELDPRGRGRSLALGARRRRVRGLDLSTDHELVRLARRVEDLAERPLAALDAAAVEDEQRVARLGEEDQGERRTGIDEQVIRSRAEEKGVVRAGWRWSDIVQGCAAEFPVALRLAAGVAPAVGHRALQAGPVSDLSRG